MTDYETLEWLCAGDIVGISRDPSKSSGWIRLERSDGDRMEVGWEDIWDLVRFEVSDARCLVVVEAARAEFGRRSLDRVLLGEIGALPDGVREAIRNCLRGMETQESSVAVVATEELGCRPLAEVVASAKEGRCPYCNQFLTYYDPYCSEECVPVAQESVNDFVLPGEVRKRAPAPENVTPGVCPTCNLGLQRWLPFCSVYCAENARDSMTLSQQRVPE